MVTAANASTLFSTDASDARTSYDCYEFSCRNMARLAASCPMCQRKMPHSSLFGSRQHAHTANPKDVETFNPFSSWPQNASFVFSFFFSLFAGQMQFLACLMLRAPDSVCCEPTTTFVAHLEPLHHPVFTRLLVCCAVAPIQSLNLINNGRSCAYSPIAHNASLTT